MQIKGSPLGGPFSLFERNAESYRNQCFKTCRYKQRGEPYHK